MKQNTLRFEDLIGPKTLQDFISTYWEKQHLFVCRRSPSFYDDLFSLAVVDKVITASSGSPHENLDIIPPPDSGRQTEKLRASGASMNKIYSSLGRGDTIRLLGVQQAWPPVAQIAATIGEALSADVNFNFYLTPAGFQGFPIHVDTHEALILQIEGSKDWFIYESIYPLPINTLSYMDAMKTKSRLPSGDSGVRLLERIHLAKGDCLYIPRGMPHQAVASTEASLHLTAGIHPLYWVDVLKRAVELVCADQLDLRKALPPGFSWNPKLQEDLAQIFRSCLRVFSDNVSPEQTLGTLAKGRVTSRPYPPDGHLEQMARVDDLHEGSLLERRDGLECLVEVSETAATVHFASSQVKGPPGIGPALEFVRDHKRFKLGELPVPSDASGKAVLARRLIREGLLRMIEEPERPENRQWESLREPAIQGRDHEPEGILGNRRLRNQKPGTHDDRGAVVDPPGRCCTLLPVGPSDRAMGQAEQFQQQRSRSPLRGRP